MCGGLTHQQAQQFTSWNAKKISKVYPKLLVLKKLAAILKILDNFVWNKISIYKEKPSN